MKALSQSLISSLAAEAGIDLARVTAVQAPVHADFFKRWLLQGYDAGMAYLGRRAHEREDPRRLMPTTQSLIVAGLVYKQPQETVEAFYREKGVKIAQYAWGEDYHDVFKAKLEVLAEGLKARWPDCDYRVYVDTGPILERDYAALAGLGWIGKNTCLIHPQKGSYLFLGVILTSLACEVAPAPMLDHCGHCRACIDACPTEALREPYTLDANRCIAYWTIEHKGEFPLEIERQAGTWQDWIFGCDICQEVCPWNRKAPETTHPEFARHSLWNEVRDVDSLLSLDELAFAQWQKTPLKRAKLAGLQRNVRAVKKGGCPYRVGGKSAISTPS